MKAHILFTLLAGLICMSLRPAFAAPDDFAGVVEAELDGKLVYFTALELDYQIDIRGDVANVQLTQSFENPLHKPVNARYLFPLNDSAAVHAMTMRVGNEEIKALIQEKAEAQATFNKAKAEGKAASLLTQFRPNMFTQRIANLMPGAPISVTIEYSQLVPKTDGAYQMVVPLVVGPRFQPPGAGVPPDETSTPTLARLPRYPSAAGVHVPATVVGERVNLAIALESGLPLGTMHSDTHPLRIRHVSSTQAEITLAAGKVLDNRDFVLRYTYDAPEASVGLLSHWETGEGGYFSMLIEPPAQAAAGDILPREMVFLLDCSGSMAGTPMQASKRFMVEALTNLRLTDSFRIIRFSDAATEFSTRPVPATPANIAAGIQYAKALYGSGGTMMSEGIRQALGTPAEPGRLRNVVFLTDGYIGNEATILSMVQSMLGSARLFAFGVGTGVNRYLLNELGRTGRGFTRYYDPTRDDESAAAIAADLASRLQSPVLADLAIDWGGLPVTDVLPRTLPDLYLGDSLRVTGRFTRHAAGSVQVQGTSTARKAILTRQIDLNDADSRPALRQIWARTAVADLEHQYVTPFELREAQTTNDELQQAITQMGLAHNLVTRWTSFVAVSRRIYNSSPESNTESDVALPRVAGVAATAYSPGPQGYAAPEPGAMVSLLAALGVITLLRWRRRIAAKVL